MHPGPVLRLAVAPVVALAVVLSVAVWASGREPDGRAPLAAAFDALPSGTVVAGFTDWASLRDGVGAEASTDAELRAVLRDDASLRDLTTRSVLGGVVEQMDDLYGWSAADLQWESYGRAQAGAVMVARLSDDVSLDDVRSAWSSLGYQRVDGVWTLGQQGRTAVGPELAATLGHVALVPGRRLVVAADSAEYVRTTLDVIDGRRDSALSIRPLADVTRSLAGSDSAVVQSRAFGCRATSLDALGADVQAQAAAALDRVAPLVAPTVTGRGLADGSPSQTIRFVSAFDSPAQARAQGQVRSALASGPFIGRSGRIEDSLVLRDVTAEGSVATLTFALDPDRGAYMSGEGPLLFASCPA